MCYYRLGSLKHRHLFITVLETGKSRIMMQADSVLSKGSPGRQLRSVCVFMRPFLNVHKGEREGGGEGERVRVCVYEREREVFLF